MGVKQVLTSCVPIHPHGINNNSHGFHRMYREEDDQSLDSSFDGLAELDVGQL